MTLPTRPDLNSSHRTLYYWFARAARLQEVRANRLKEVEIRRQSRRSPGGDAASWNDEAVKNPMIKGEIADQQFYGREGVLHGIGAILEELEHIRDQNAHIIRLLEVIAGLPRNAAKTSQ